MLHAWCVYRACVGVVVVAKSSGFDVYDGISYYVHRSCLWCVHFKTHAEREEIRKLLSVKYIIKEISFPRAETQTQYDETMEPWLTRIDEFLDAMREKDSETDSIINEVWHEIKFEGVLTPYWLNWMEMLDDLGRFA